MLSDNIYFDFFPDSHTSHFFYCVIVLDKVSQLMFDIIYSGFLGGTAVKNPPANKGDTRDPV